MTTYEYEAKTQRGQVTTGRLHASSRDSACAQLQEQNLFTVSLKSSTKTRVRKASPHATSTEVAWQMWQLSMMIDTGLSLSDSLACLAHQARRPALRALVEDVERRVREGASLSVSMEAHPRVFPQSLVALVRASELSGAFKEVLRKASQYLMTDLKTVRRLRGALIYPVAMLGICAAVTVFLLTFVLPRFAGVFASHKATLPLPTRILMGLSEGVMANWPLLLFGATALAAIVAYWSRSSAGRRLIDQLVISAPVAAPLFNTLYQSRSFSAMALMVQSHVPLADAIRVAQNLAPNSLYRALWRDVEEQIRVGERMAAPLLHAPFVSESIAQVIDNGDRNGKLGLVFSHVAEFLEEDFNRVLQATMQLIEPCLIVIMGSVIAFVAVALMLPLVQASHVVSH